jgi:prepilin-type N-terminal cleavage/methylation domain-containing protein/prepilin-type processing-associated H-X9-DG protein
MGILSRSSAVRKRGFTLIELLVVIAIIALLAAILFPVFARAREAAKKSSCQSNLHQLGLAVAQYQNDFDSTYPFIQADENWNHAWPVTLQPYIKNLQVFFCPSDGQAGLPSPVKTDSGGGPGWAGTQISYAANAIYSDTPSFGQANNGVFNLMASSFSNPGTITESKVNFPSSTVMIAEKWSADLNSNLIANANGETDLGNSSAWGYASGFIASGGTNWVTWLGTGNLPPDPKIGGTKYGTGSYGYVSAGHNGQSNFLYCDGHVKSLVPIATCPQTNESSDIPELYYNNGHEMNPFDQWVSTKGSTQ